MLSSRLTVTVLECPACGHRWTIMERAAHARAARLKSAIVACEWEPIGGCRGSLEVAHVDGQPANNDPANLLKLCRSHHALLDRGRIDPRAPRMPDFRLGGDGRRRYYGPRAP